MLSYDMMNCAARAASMRANMVVGNSAKRKPSRSSPRKRGTHNHRLWLWVPALAALGRDDDRLVRAKYQPAAVRSDRWRNSIVSGLLFTMDGATETCRAASTGGPPRRRRPSRARACQPRVHSDASYQTYCHAKAITITTTAVNRPSCAQTLAAKLRPSVLSLWIVMADDLPFGRHL